VQNPVSSCEYDSPAIYLFDSFPRILILQIQILNFNNMKKAFLLAGLILLVLPAMSQPKKYKKAMQSAVKTMNAASDPVSQLELAATFEGIAEAYPDQWLPLYHAGRILVINSFVEGDPDKKDAMLDRMKRSLDRALELAPGESEVHVLESLYYIGLIAVDAESRGPIYYQDALEAIGKSKTLDPENPRAWYMDAMMTLNMPEFMGGGPEAAKPVFQKALEKFKAFKTDNPFWPGWGEDLVQTELDRLNP
jgi:tetratricopeptide (TPR) repeat protein